MQAYWITFAGAAPGCVEAATEDEAKGIAVATRKADIASCKPLPYPANPRINKHENQHGACPSFCYTPEACAGRSCCPKRYACSE